MLTSNKIISNAVDASVNQTSGAYYLKNVFGIAIQALFTGSPVGSILLQGSCDNGSEEPDEAATGDGVVNWNTIINSPQNVTGAGLVTWNFNGVFYKWIRVVYTAASGTGTLTITVNTKGS